MEQPMATLDIEIVLSDELWTRFEALAELVESTSSAE